jgi:hypothetical protein
MKLPLNDSKKKTGKHQQCMLQPVAYRVEGCEVVRREKGLLHVQNTQRIFGTHTDMSINRSMHESGIIMVKARKTMNHCKMQNYFWTAMEKGVHGYTRHPVGRAIDTPFPPTYENRQNSLKLAFREQYKIGWDNLLKGLMGKQWSEYAKIHLEHENIKLQAKEWAPKIIQTLWDHML